MLNSGGYLSRFDCILIRTIITSSSSFFRTLSFILKPLVWNNNKIESLHKRRSCYNNNCDMNNDCDIKRSFKCGLAVWSFLCKVLFFFNNTCFSIFCSKFKHNLWTIYLLKHYPLMSYTVQYLQVMRNMSSNSLLLLDRVQFSNQTRNVPMGIFY